MVVRIRSTFTDIQHLFLLVLYIHLISALRESSAKLVYGTQGGSITFHLEERPDPTFQDFYWTFYNNRLAACGPDKCTIYTEKASVCNTTFSLELKDIAQADDGDYTAVLVGKNGKVENISNHRLIVQAPVSKPVIHTSAVSSSDGRCNVTLNCTAERGTGVSLQWDWTGIHHTAINAHNGSVLYFSLDPNADGSFTCKAHNQVSNSSENVSVEKIKCFNSSENTILVIIIVAILASVLLTVAVVTMAFQKHRRADNCNVEERTDVHGDLELEDSKQDIPRLDPDQIAEGVFDVEVVQVKEEEMEVSVDHVTQEEGWKTQTEDLKGSFNLPNNPRTSLLC